MARHFNRSQGLYHSGLPDGFDQGDDTPNFTIVGAPAAIAPSIFATPDPRRDSTPVAFLDDEDLQP